MKPAAAVRSQVPPTVDSFGATVHRVVESYRTLQAMHATRHGTNVCPPPLLL